MSSMQWNSIVFRNLLLRWRNLAISLCHSRPLQTSNTTFCSCLTMQLQGTDPSAALDSDKSSLIMGANSGCKDHLTLMQSVSRRGNSSSICMNQLMYPTLLFISSTASVFSLGLLASRSSPESDLSARAMQSPLILMELQMPYR